MLIKLSNILLNNVLKKLENNLVGNFNSTLQIIVRKNNTPVLLEPKIFCPLSSKLNLKPHQLTDLSTSIHITYYIFLYIYMYHMSLKLTYPITTIINITIKNANFNVSRLLFYLLETWGGWTIYCCWNYAYLLACCCSFYICMLKMLFFSFFVLFTFDCFPSFTNL
jgi:hypothetical protein